MLEERRVLRTSHTRNNHQPELHEESHLSVENMKLTFGYLGYPVRVHPRMQIDYFQTQQRGEFQEKKKRKLIHYVLSIDAVFAIISRFIIDIH